MAWREAIKKPVAKPTAPKPKFETRDDDWDTDLTYQNIGSEKSQRYGSESVPGTGRIDHVDFKTIQEKVKTADQTVRQVYQDKNPNRGYGGKYGKDQVMDKSAADFSYQAQVEKHPSQIDGKKGFGGAYGIDERGKDKSAVGFDYQAPVEKHSSQTDFSKGFGGKYGVDTHAQDKSAVGFAHQETLSKHSSQTDYSSGFGGKYGKDAKAQDKSAVDFGHHETLAKHSSQKDYSMGFGGKYGIQKEEASRLAGSSSPPSEHRVVDKPLPPMGSSAGVGNIRARFENIKKEQEEEAARRVAEERNKRSNFDQQAREKPTSTKNGHTAVKPAEPPRAPSPPPTQYSDETIYQNMSEHFPNQPTIESRQSESEKYVAGINVSSLLRQRTTSSSSSKHEDDEWAADQHHSNNQPSMQYREPSPTPQVESNNNHQNEGIRCIARYSYQKTEADELGFEENEIITHVEKSHDEWWFGRIGPRSGLFPMNYVEELS